MLYMYLQLISVALGNTLVPRTGFYDSPATVQRLGSFGGWFPNEEDADDWEKGLPLTTCMIHQHEGCQATSRRVT